MVFTGTYAIKIGVCFDHRSSLSAQKIAATRRHRKREPAMAGSFGSSQRGLMNIFDIYIYIYIDLGKLSYFTNLNCWAMWGWFHYKNHDFQWGRSEVVIIYPIIYIYLSIYWLMVYLPLWKMMELKSVGMMTFPIYGKIKSCSKPPISYILFIHICIYIYMCVQ